MTTHELQVLHDILDSLDEFQQVTTAGDEHVSHARLDMLAARLLAGRYALSEILLDPKTRGLH